MKWFGLIVEGQCDEEVIPSLIKRCSSNPSEIKFIIRNCRGIANLRKQFSKFLKEFEYMKPHGQPLLKAFVVRDADNKNSDELRKEILEEIDSCSYSFPVCPIVAVNQLESWLLSDEAALKTIMGATVKQVRDPEHLTDPKTCLEQILSGKFVYTPARAKAIAEAIDLQVMLNRCPSFRSLYNAAQCQTQGCKARFQ